MKTMNTRKRVSFGSKGSMVETWIIDDVAESRSFAEMEFYKILKQDITKRLESRDNPFVPGGELSKETDDLLKRATIIRDHFLLEEEAKKKLLEDQKQNGKGDNSAKTTGTDGKQVQEEAILPETTQLTAVEPKLRENGKPGDPASPDSVKVDIPKDQSAPVADKTVAETGDMQKDKKKGNKCCTVM